MTILLSDTTDVGLVLVSIDAGLVMDKTDDSMIRSFSSGYSFAFFPVWNPARRKLVASSSDITLVVTTVDIGLLHDSESTR